MDRILATALKSSKQSFLLIGPRQTGKTTLLESLNPDVTIQLAHEEEFLDFSRSPRRLDEILDAHPKAKLILVYEIQRLPALLNTIQVWIDRSKKQGGRPIRFALTGSSYRKLKRGGANLLPGRLLNFSLGGVCSAELDYKMDSDRVLSLGMLPEPYLSTDPIAAQKLLRSYAAHYLKEEIQAEALTRDLQGFVRFLETACASSGQYIDFTKISNQAKISRHTVPRYFEILEDTLVAFRLEECPWINEGVKLVKHPKFYFFDPGVLNGIFSNFNVSNDRVGLLFEHLIVSQLMASAAARDLPIRVTHFRTHAGLEVDFVVELEGKLYLIEAKASDPSPTEVQRIETIQKLLGRESQGMIWVLKSRHARKSGSTWILPWQEGLKAMGL